MLVFLLVCRASPGINSIGGTLMAGETCGTKLTASYTNNNLIISSCSSFFLQSTKANVDITLKDCTFTDVGSTTDDVVYGGCITCTGSGKGNVWIITSCKFTRCKAKTAGAAVSARSLKNLEIISCEFKECDTGLKSSDVDGSTVNVYDNISASTINNSVFIGNPAGGVIYRKETANSVHKMYNCTFNSTSTTEAMAVPAISTCQQLTVATCHFYNLNGNLAAAIMMRKFKDTNIYSITVSDSDFINCTSANGGIINCDKYLLELDLSNCIVENCTSNKGAIYAEKGTLNIAGSTFSSSGSKSINTVGTTSVRLSTSKFMHTDDVTNYEGIHVTSANPITVDSDTKFQGDSTSVVPSTGIANDQFVGSFEESPTFNACDNVLTKNQIIFTNNEEYDGSGCTKAFILVVKLDIDSIKIVKCKFSNYKNLPSQAGPITFANNGTANKLEVTETSFSSCVSTDVGSAMFIRSVKEIIIDNCAFTECTSSSYDTGKYGGTVNIFKECPSIIVKDCAFTKSVNGALSINNIDNKLEKLYNCTFERCSLDSKDSSPCINIFIDCIISSCVFNNNINSNTETGVSGTIYHGDGLKISIIDSEFVNNKGTYTISFIKSSNILISGSFFDKNLIASSEFEAKDIIGMTAAVSNCSFVLSDTYLDSYSQIDQYYGYITFNCNLEIKDCCFSGSPAKIASKPEFKYIGSPQTESISFSIISTKFTGADSNIPTSSAIIKTDVTFSETDLKCERPHEIIDEKGPTCNNDIDTEEFTKNNFSYVSEGCDYYGKVVATVTNLNIEHCSFSNYDSTNTFGCISIDSLGSVNNFIIVNTTFDKCQCNDAGSSLYLQNIKILKIDGCTFKECEIKDTTTSVGGSICCYNRCDDILIQKCNFTSCIGGGIGVSTGNIINKIYNCSFSDCISIFSSSGIISKVSLIVDHCVFYDCSGEKGGVIYQDAGASNVFTELEVVRCSGNYIFYLQQLIPVSFLRCYFEDNKQSNACLSLKGTAVAVEDCSFTCLKTVAKPLINAGSAGIKFTRCCFTGLSGVTNTYYINSINLNQNFVECTVYGNQDNINIKSGQDFTGIQFKSGNGECPRFINIEENPIQSSIFDDNQESSSVQNNEEAEMCGVVYAKTEKYGLLNKDLDGTLCNDFYIKFTSTIPQIEIRGCSFSNYDSANAYGCISIDTTGSVTSSLTIIDTKFNKCKCSNSGSSLHLQSIKSINIDGCSFNECEIKDTTVYQDGTIYCKSDCDDILVQNTNFTTCAGGCIGIEEAGNKINQILNCCFKECRRKSVSSGINCKVSLVVNHCVFDDCSGQDGAVIYQGAGTTNQFNELEVFNCVGNYMFYLKTGIPITIKRSYFFENKPNTAVLYLSAANIIVEDCSLIGLEANAMPLVSAAKAGVTFTRCCFTGYSGTNYKYINSRNYIQTFEDCSVFGNLGNLEINTNQNSNGISFKSGVGVCPKYINIEEKPLDTSEEVTVIESSINQNAEEPNCGIVNNEEADFMLSEQELDGASCNNFYIKFESINMKIEIRSCSFANYGSQEGEGCIIFEGMVSNFQIVSTKFVSCKSKDCGSAMLLKDIDEITIDNCEFKDCVVKEFDDNAILGGIIHFISSCQSIIINNNQFSSCEGGCITILQKQNVISRIYNNTFNQCINTKTLYYSACINSIREIKLEKCYFYNINGVVSALYCDTQLEMIGVEIENCTADYSIYINEYLLFDIRKCYFCNNSATEFMLSNSMDETDLITDCSFIVRKKKDVSSFYFNGKQIDITGSCFSTVTDELVDGFTYFPKPQTTIINIRNSLFRGVRQYIPDGDNIHLDGVQMNYSIVCIRPPDEEEKDKFTSLEVMESSEVKYQTSEIDGEKPLYSSEIEPEITCNIEIKTGESLTLSNKQYNGCDNNFVYVQVSVIKIVIDECTFVNYGTDTTRQGCIAFYVSDLVGGGSADELKIINSVFDTCHSLDGGAALFLRDVKKSLINECVFTNCITSSRDYSTRHGGAVSFIEYCPDINVNNCNFTDCPSGGITVELDENIMGSNKVSSISNCRFENNVNNYAKLTAGLFIEHPCIIERCSFINLKSQSGPVLLYYSQAKGYFVFKDIEVINCEATTTSTSEPGVILFLLTSSSFENAYFESNKASYSVLNFKQTATITRSSFVTSGTTSIRANKDIELSFSESCFAFAPSSATTSVHLSAPNTRLVFDHRTTFQGTKDNVNVGSSYLDKMKFTKNLKCPLGDPTSEPSYVPESPYSEEIVIESSEIPPTPIPNCQLSIAENEEFSKQDESFDGTECKASFIYTQVSIKSIRIEKCNFTNYGSAEEHGCIVFDDFSSADSVILLETNFVNVVARTGGSALYLQNIVDLKINECSFSKSKVTSPLSNQHGSAIQCLQKCGITIENSNFDHCENGCISIEYNSERNVLNKLYNCYFKDCISSNSNIAAGLNSAVDGATIEHCFFYDLVGLGSAAILAFTSVSSFSLTFNELEVVGCQTSSKNGNTIKIPAVASLTMSKCYFESNNVNAESSVLYFDRNFKTITECSFVSSGSTSINIKSGTVEFEKCCFSLVPETTQKDGIHITSLKNINIDSATYFQGTRTSVSITGQTIPQNQFKTNLICEKRIFEEVFISSIQDIDSSEFQDVSSLKYDDKESSDSSYIDTNGKEDTQTIYNDNNEPESSYINSKDKTVDSSIKINKDPSTTTQEESSNINANDQTVCSNIKRGEDPSITTQEASSYKFDKKEDTSFDIDVENISLKSGETATKESEVIGPDSIKGGDDGKLKGGHIAGIVIAVIVVVIVLIGLIIYLLKIRSKDLSFAETENEFQETIAYSSSGLEPTEMPTATVSNALNSTVVVEDDEEFFENEPFYDSDMD